MSVSRETQDHAELREAIQYVRSELRPSAGTAVDVVTAAAESRLHQVGENPDKLRKAIKSLRDNINCTNIEWRDLTEMVCAAAESTLPRTKMVQVWRVEYAGKDNGARVYQCREQRVAEAVAREYGESGARCIRVTGPHQQEVPA